MEFIEFSWFPGRARLPQKMPPWSIWSPQWDRDFLRIPPYGYPEEQETEVNKRIVF